MSKILGNMINLSILLSLISCSELLTRRTYVDEMERQSDGIFVAGRDFRQVPGDTGQAYRSRKEILQRTPASQKVMERREDERSLINELRRRENALTPRQLSTYQRRKMYLDGPSEQLYYLQLSRPEREDYLAGKMIKTSRSSARSYRDSPLSLVQDYKRAEKNLFLGMNKDAVERSWGMPSRIDVAGNPRNQNERWTFYDGRKVKKIFFENGIVGGWATD